MTEPRRCNRCGNPLRSDAPAGTSCPVCMLRAGLDASGEEMTFGFEPTQPGRVLESLARSIGPIPRVLLPDTATDDAGVAIIKPSSDEMPGPGERGDRYQLFGEIARGGMGAVLKGRDPDLGRDLAVKVLLESHHDKPELVRRFVEEAQIGGQLQHPGIVPVYELGAFADRRPYFTMKLVKGRTLSALLAERQSAAHDLPRFLGIFEAVCQTLAYAHARGVIHRDLKPSNVMVGSFGEVQVMDWGLAKVLKEGGVADEPADQPAPEVSVIATVRSGSDVDQSQAGSVLGTPAYMAPEQAAGEVERVDRRADVFGLGSILCEILSGGPAYTGRGSGEILRKAMRGDNADALSRLNTCGAEGELIALAKDCMAVETADRPRDAGAVAERMTAYLAGVQARVQAAERERAVAVARAIEERRRRKLQLGLAAALLALTTLGGLSTTYYLQQRAARAAAVDRILGKAVTLREQAAAEPEDLSRWQVALAAVEQVDAGDDGTAQERLMALHSVIKEGLDAARRDRTLLDRLVEIRSAEADDMDGAATDAAYTDAFRDAGIDFAILPPEEAGAKIRARPTSVALVMADAVDDWAEMRRGRGADAAAAARLSAAARVADPEPWRNKLRTTLDQPDKASRLAGLQALAKEAKLDELGAISLQLLGSGLNAAGDRELAESVLRTAQHRHPDDVWVNYVLATVLQKLSRRDEAIRYYIAARAIRPETAHVLAHALSAKGESDEAIEVFRDLTRLNPKNGRHLMCLGQELNSRGPSAEAEAAFNQAVATLREAIRINPDDGVAHFHLGVALCDGKREYAAAEAEFRTAIGLKLDTTVTHSNLGIALANQGKLDPAIAEYRTAIGLRPDNAVAHSILGRALMDQGNLEPAVAEYRTAIRLNPDLASVHYELGNALHKLGRPELAIAEYRTAIQLRPDYVEAHNNLAATLSDQGQLDLAIDEYREAIRIKPDHAGAHSNLGACLSDQGKLDLAITEYREAIRIKPDLAQAHNNLGNALRKQGKLEEAIAECRTTIRLEPNNAHAHSNLGLALASQGKLDDAIVEFRSAVRLKPDFAGPHCELGIVLTRQGKLDLAITEYREAIRIKPDYAEAHCNLGLLLQEKVDAAEVLDLLRKGHELGSRRPGWQYPSAQWVAGAERILALANRLPGIVSGEDKPRDNAERLAFAQMAYKRKHFAVAYRLWSEALENDPKLVDIRRAQHRYNAACAAALVAAGQDKKGPPPDDAAKMRLRRQTLDWLKAELTAWRKILESGPPQARPAIVEVLSHWKQDTDLASVRDAPAVAKLPTDEQNAWQSLWTEVDSLLKRAGSQR